MFGLTSPVGQACVQRGAAQLCAGEILIPTPPPTRPSARHRHRAWPETAGWASSPPPARATSEKRFGCLRIAAVMLVCLTPLASGCAPTAIAGRAASMMYDPNRVGGLPTSDGPNGLRNDAPTATGEVQDSDGGDNDRLALLAVNDIQSFWTSTFPRAFSGQYTPVTALRSYDATNPRSPRACGSHRSYGEPNAAFCSLDGSVSWDRGILIPDARK